jgi:hypothetical protein
MVMYGIPSVFDMEYMLTNASVFPIAKTAIGPSLKSLQT